MKLSTFFNDINENTWEYRDLANSDYISAIKLLYGIVDFVKVDVENKTIISCEIDSNNNMLSSILLEESIDKFIEGTPLQKGRVSLYPEVEFKINKAQRKQLLKFIYDSEDTTKTFINRFLDKYTKKVESITAINLVPQMDKIADEFNSSRDNLLEYIKQLDENEIFNAIQNTLDKELKDDYKKKVMKWKCKGSNEPLEVSRWMLI